MFVHRFAVATAVATYLLILIGGLVHGTGSSLACPDWPTCYGTMMPKMEGGVLVEHSHRLAAGVVLIMTLSLAILLQWRPARLVRGAEYTLGRLRPRKATAVPGLRVVQDDLLVQLVKAHCRLPSGNRSRRGSRTGLRLRIPGTRRRRRWCCTGTRWPAS